MRNLLSGLGEVIFDHQVFTDALSDPRGGVLDRIPGKVGVARGRLHLCVTQ